MNDSSYINDLKTQDWSMNTSLQVETLCSLNNIPKCYRWCIWIATTVYQYQLRNFLQCISWKRRKHIIATAPEGGMDSGQLTSTSTTASWTPESRSTAFDTDPALAELLIPVAEDIALASDPSVEMLMCFMSQCHFKFEYCLYLPLVASQPALLYTKTLLFHPHQSMATSADKRNEQTSTNREIKSKDHEMILLSLSFWPGPKKRASAFAYCLCFFLLLQSEQLSLMV